MRLPSILLAITLIFVLGACSVQVPITLAFYNVENLFDTIDTPNKIDEEFLPGTDKDWNTKRYQKKLDDIAQVISKIDSINLPALMGVCEVENDIVLSDLVSNPKLRKANYQFIWKDGVDVRGIDCALLYNPSLFEVVHFESIEVKMENDPEFKTRDILYVEGELEKEAFHLFICHWPSRRGGELVSNPKRAFVASLISKKVNAIQNENQNANIIIMGDFNDEPSDSSVAQVLGAVPNTLPIENTQLVNLMYDDMLAGLGSYNYRNDWNMLDNLVVSGYLINKKKGWKTTIDNGYIFHQPFMEYYNNKGEMSPNRTYGRSYYGGISDHFPVYLILEK